MLRGSTPTWGNSVARERSSESRKAEKLVWYTFFTCERNEERRENWRQTNEAAQKQEKSVCTNTERFTLAWEEGWVWPLLHCSRSRCTRSWGAPSPAPALEAAPWTCFGCDGKFVWEDSELCWWLILEGTVWKGMWHPFSLHSASWSDVLCYIGLLHLLTHINDHDVSFLLFMIKWALNAITNVKNMTFNDYPTREDEWGPRSTSHCNIVKYMHQ